MKLLDKNAALWDKVDEAYDEQIAANEPDMTKELLVCDGSVCDGAGNSYEDFIREMKGLTEDERAALLSGLAAVEEIEKKIDDLYARLNDNNAESIYDEIDALDDEIVKLLDKNAVLWDKVYEAYDEQVAANEPDMTWELTEKDFPLCG